MKYSLSLLCALLLAGCGGMAGTAVPEKGLPTVADAALLKIPDGYALVWSDEFGAQGLPDTAKWAYDTGMNKAGWHNHELQYYSGPRAENAELRNGKLVITARKEQLTQAADWGGQRYTSTRLITLGKAEWMYGYFEIRAKLPCGKGSWPAIWLLNSAGVWPAGGELDVMEHIGREPGRVFSTTHTTAGSGGNGQGAAVQVPDACDAFHTYQMDWTAQQVHFGVDGKTHFSYPNLGLGKDQWPFDTPQFLILNIAVGGDFGGAVDDSIFPIQMEVDYVRVYQKAR